MATSEDPIVLLDAIGRDTDGSMGHPFLTFDADDGRVTIADDYETWNDRTPRDFILTQDDAVRLAAALLDYAMHGTPSTVPCVSQFDVDAAVND